MVDVPAALAHLRAHGWAPLGRVLDVERARALAARADEIMLGQAPRDGLFFQADSPSGSYDDLEFGAGWIGPSLSYRKVEKLERDPLFAAWIGDPVCEAIARAWIDGEARTASPGEGRSPPIDVSIYRACLFAKAAAGGTHLPWHQDGGIFWGVDRAPTLQMWTALDDVPVESGCVEVLPGSHLAGLARPSGGNIPREQVEAADAEAKALPLPARVGDAYLIHNHVWHRSGVNLTGRPRRALTVCYMDAATRCLRKKHAPRTFFRPFPSPTP